MRNTRHPEDVGERREEKKEYMELPFRHSSPKVRSS